MRSLRTVIVDDEPLARKRLRRLLEARDDVAIVGEAGDGKAACAIIDRERPDLVLLDIQMPGMSGFDVLRALQWRPHVVFVTAYDEYAVRAFDEQALDYVLKPVEPERLARALERARAASDDRFDRILDAVARMRPSGDRLAARQGAKISLVDPASICFVRAEDKYSVIYTTDQEHVLDRTIEDLERTLDPGVFLRIHRSAIVNLTFVRELVAVEGGRFKVLLRDARATALHASRRGAALLRERLRL
jgi:two-component system, LytTR family, response regulator